MGRKAEEKMKSERVWNHANAKPDPALYFHILK